MITKIQYRILVSLILSLGILSLFLTGCASVRENEALFRARAAYDKAASDPMVSANAPVALAEAREELRRAENADSEDQMTHESYMTIKRTEIAVAIAQEKAAQEERQRLAQEKDTILLQQKEKQITSARRQAETAQAQMRAMEQELANLKAQKTERGYVVTLGDILFTTNKAELMPGAQGTLDQVAAFLKAHPEIKVVVQGHTDNVGSSEYNMTLSKARAESVKSALMARGIAPERITTEGRGEIAPIASNSTAAGRQQNRRVELVFTPTVASGR